MKEYKYIVARALNSYEATSPITALGIKCLMDQMRSERIRKKLPIILKRKLEVSNKLLLRDYQILKSRAEGGNSYRKVVAPSAFSALMEAEFFRTMVIEEQNLKSVFSYRIPSNKEKKFRNFEYYYENYIQMNKSILASMYKNKCDSVLIIDLKAFYPSIDTKSAIYDFGKNQAVYDSILNTYDLYQEGLPIGLDLSHLIAQYYLKQFDQVLMHQFGNRYFRYVDDISIVCNESDKENITACIQSYLPEGLEINNDKLDIANKASWEKITDQIEERYKLDSFATYFSIYVYFNPNISEIKDFLEQHNYHIPLYKFSERTKTSRFNRFFNLLYKKRLRLLSSIFRWSKDDLINFLKNRKVYHLRAVDESIEEVFEFEYAKDIYTRFRLQNIKYHLSNLFYLLSDDELVSLKNRLPNHADLFYFDAIVDALVNHNFQPLFEVGGRYVVILAEMWLTREKETIILNPSSFINFDNYAESIIYLSIAGVLEVDIKCIETKFKNQREFKFVSSILNREVKQATDCEYTNEMQLLFSKYDNTQLKQLLLSQFDKTDEVSFYALEEGAY